MGYAVKAGTLTQVAEKTWDAIAIAPGIEVADLYGFVHDTDGNPLAACSITLNGHETATILDGIFSILGIQHQIMLAKGDNSIIYPGLTKSLPEALTNIGPDGLNVFDIVWHQVNGEWISFYFYNGEPRGELTELEQGKTYVVTVSEDCIWEIGADYTITCKKEGYKDYSESISLIGGRNDVDIKMLREDEEESWWDKLEMWQKFAIILGGSAVGVGLLALAFRGKGK